MSTVEPRPVDALEVLILVDNVGDALRRARVVHGIAPATSLLAAADTSPPRASGRLTAGSDDHAATLSEVSVFVEPGEEGAR